MMANPGVRAQNSLRPRPTLRVLSLWTTQTPFGLPSFFKDPRFASDGPAAAIPLYRLTFSRGPANRLIRFVEIFVDDLKFSGPGNTKIRLKLALRQ